MNKLLSRFSVLALLLVNSYATAVAADPPKAAPSVKEIALYQGPDRQERLVEAARKEGELLIYNAAPIEDLQPIATAFTRKYGVKVKFWRASSESVLRRVLSEAQGGRFEVDIVENNAPENEALHRENLLQEVRSPHIKDLIPQASPAHKEWVGSAYDVFVAAYNTNLVKKEELPKTYQDLNDPKWKGRLGIEAEDQGWFATVVEEMADQQGLKLFNEIATKNGFSVRKGHSLLANLVASGEVPLALTAYNWKPMQLKEKGVPIEWFTLSPAIAQFRTVAMPKKAPHPHAAVLFYDFMLSEGQALLASRSLVPTSKKTDFPLAKVPVKFIDPVRALDMQAKWIKTYDEVIIKRAR